MTLARKYLTTPFVMIKDAVLRESLGMKPGNITLYKNANLEREEFPHTNSWERWESFVATILFPRHQLLGLGADQHR